jgi:hypothetical protein
MTKQKRKKQRGGGNVFKSRDEWLNYVIQIGEEKYIYDYEIINKEGLEAKIAELPKDKDILDTLGEEFLICDQMSLEPIKVQNVIVIHKFDYYLYPQNSTKNAFEKDKYYVYDFEQLKIWFIQQAKDRNLHITGSNNLTYIKLYDNILYKEELFYYVMDYKNTLFVKFNEDIDINDILIIKTDDENDDNVYQGYVGTKIQKNIYYNKVYIYANYHIQSNTDKKQIECNASLVEGYMKLLSNNVLFNIYSDNDEDKNYYILFKFDIPNGVYITYKNNSHVRLKIAIIAYTLYSESTIDNIENIENIDIINEIKTLKPLPPRNKDKGKNTIRTSDIINEKQILKPLPPRNKEKSKNTNGILANMKPVPSRINGGNNYIFYKDTYGKRMRKKTYNIKNKLVVKDGKYKNGNIKYISIKTFYKRHKDNNLASSLHEDIFKVRHVKPEKR